MGFSPKTVKRLAYMTRRWDRYANPLKYRFGHRLARSVHRRLKRKPFGAVVVPYDEGLMNVDPSTELGYKVMFHGYHDVEMSALIKRIVRPGDVCVDVGANVGAYTLIMAFAAGPSGRVIALEPHPDVAARLLANVVLNHLGNVRVIKAALSQQDGESVLYTFGADDANELTANLSPGRDVREEVRVKTICGKTLEKASAISRCDLVKVDILGAEMIALGELSGLIARYKPCLFVEYRRPTWEKWGRCVEEAVELLHSWEYQLYVVCAGLTLPLAGEVPDKCNLFCVPAGKEADVAAATGRGQ